jgi:NADPH-dependent F420 reductase
MRIGIIGGTGPAGSGLALRMSVAGHQVLIGSRSKERSEEKAAELIAQWPDHNLKFDTGTNEAAAKCDLIVVATPWDSTATIVGEHAESLRGKVVVTMANALVKVGKEFQPLVPPRGSIAAHVQAEIPGSRVVAAMQHLPAKELGNLNHHVDSDVLICSDFPEAIEIVSDLVAQIPGCRPLSTGRLSNALALEAFTAVLLQLNVRYKTRVAPRLTGIPDIDPVSGRNMKLD